VVKGEGRDGDGFKRRVIRVNRDCGWQGEEGTSPPHLGLAAYVIPTPHNRLAWMLTTSRRARVDKGSLTQSQRIGRLSWHEWTNSSNRL